jgi:uncharacterized SAM-dependent methyltransferase
MSATSFLLADFRIILSFLAAYDAGHRLPEGIGLSLAYLTKEERHAWVQQLGEVV